MAGDNSDGLAAALAGLEEVYGDGRRFRSFCDRLQKERLELSDHPFTHWYLHTAKAGPLPRSSVVDEFAGTIPPHWTWQDPFGDCSCSARGGLEIHAANGRDLLDHNRTAPRLLRQVTGEFVFETV